MHPILKPWERVDIDLIGPLKVKTPSGEHELRALTMIDPATGWFEIKDMVRPDADTWLSRYPRPRTLGFDGGGEYKDLIDRLRRNYGMKRAQTTPRNPQTNGIIERVHQVLNNCLRTFDLEERKFQERVPWGPFLSAAAYCPTQHVPYYVTSNSGAASVWPRHVATNVIQS